MPQSSSTHQMESIGTSLRLGQADISLVRSRLPVARRQHQSSNEPEPNDSLVPLAGYDLDMQDQARCRWEPELKSAILIVSIPGGVVPVDLFDLALRWIRTGEKS